MSPAAIEVRHLSKRFGSVVAVDDLDLLVAPGETVAVLGPNGAGKTTALDVIAGFAAPTSGTVRVLGRDPRRADRRWRARVATVSQRTSLDDQVTVREVLEVFASLYADSVPVAHVLDAFDLGAHRGRRIGSLSDGQRRRVDLALSVIGRPGVVFLDEPTTGLDPHARRRTWRLIGDIATAGAAVVLTTHHIDEAAELADRVVVLVGGRKVVDEPPAALRRRSGPVAVRLHVADVDERAELIALLPGAAELPTGEVRCTTGDVTATLDRVVRWARRHERPLADLEVAPATLEDAYVALTATRERRSEPCGAG